MPEVQKTKNLVPIPTYPTPAWGTAPVDGISVIDELLVETIDPTGSTYKRIPEGSAHPDTKKYPSHRLLREEFVAYGENRRIWCNGYRNEDQYNYSISYSGESNSHPIFSRRYMVRRDTYDPASTTAKRTSFSGIYLIRVDVGGSGYDQDIPPTVTLSGGGGVGATAQAIVDKRGSVSWVYLTNEGVGYTSAPTVIFSSGIAAATAFVNTPTSVVASVTVTTPGTGWVTAPTVTFSGGGGSGAQGVAQVSNGVIVAVLVTHNGTGYTSNPTVSFSGVGTGGTATVTRETVTMELVKEDVEYLPDDDPRRSLYLVMIRQYESLPGPVLFERKFIPFISQYANIQKRIVSAAVVPPDMSYIPVVPGQITEYQSLSKYRSVQIISSLSTRFAWENGGEDVVYYGTVNYSFPNEIPEDPSVHVYFVLQGASLAIDFGWVCDVIEGYSGPCRAKFTKRYTFTPDDPVFQAALPTVTLIEPQSHVINDGFIWDGDNKIAKATQFVLPSALHPDLEIDVTGTAPPIVNLPGPITTIPATTPPTIAHGDEIVVSIKPTEYDFGLWIYQIISVFKP